MSRSFTNITSGQRPINPRQAADFRQAKSLKSDLMGKAKRFERLDGKGADEDGHAGTVFVGDDTTMPKSMSIGKALLTGLMGGAVPEEKALKGEGFLRSEGGDLKSLDIRTTDESGEKNDYRYTRSGDGTEVYHGPSGDGGYMMVRENKLDGTLFIATDDKPMHRSFGSLEQADFQPPSDSSAKPEVRRPSGLTRGRSPLLMTDDAPKVVSAPTGETSPSTPLTSANAVGETKSVAGAPNISVQTGDITQIEADGLLAPINSSGMWFGAIDGAIQGKGGPQFHNQARERLSHLSDGDSLVAEKKQDHDGKFNDVVFVVDDLKRPLSQVVTSGLRAAEEAGMKSLAIPTMRMGVLAGAYEKTPAETLDQLAKGVKDFYADGESHTLDNITLTAYKDEASAGFLRERLA